MLSLPSAFFVLLLLLYTMHVGHRQNIDISREQVDIESQIN